MQQTCFRITNILETMPSKSVVCEWITGPDVCLDDVMPRQNPVPSSSGRCDLMAGNAATSDSSSFHNSSVCQFITGTPSLPAWCASLPCDVFPHGAPDGIIALHTCSSVHALPFEHPFVLKSRRIILPPCVFSTHLIPVIFLFHSCHPSCRPLSCHHLYMVSPCFLFLFLLQILLVASFALRGR